MIYRKLINSRRAFFLFEEKKIFLIKGLSLSIIKMMPYGNGKLKTKSVELQLRAKNLQIAVFRFFILNFKL